MQLGNERITSVPWAVVTFTREQSFFARAQHVWDLRTAQLVAVVFCAVCGGAYLVRRYLPPLRALSSGVAALQARRYDTVSEPGVDELKEIIQSFNRGATILRDQFHALETLGEIDKLLLGSAELEQVLDAVLSRVQTVTRCDCVGITLRDADAPGRGRVYLAGSGLTDLHVRRVELDDDMISTLAGESSGLTVARSEETRHSFLKPLKEIGAEFFWVWPVSVADRVEAILAVKYHEATAAAP